MDFETMADCFVAVFEDYKQDIRKVFVVSHLTDSIQFKKFIAFLQDNIAKDEWHISYNGLAFDAQITEYILENHENWDGLGNDNIARIIYQYAQKVINRQKDELPEYPEWRMKIKQIDLFKMNHWDNAAKRSGLKWIQYSMDWDNVEDMPLHHTHSVTSVDEMKMIIKYCINDVKSTKRIFEISKEQLQLRQSLSKEYNLNLYSASETRISKELFAHFLSQKLNIPKHEVKKMRTIRKHIYLNECIFPYIEFKTPEFQKLLDFYKGQVVTETKSALKYSVIYKGVKTDYGLGGIHGVADPGVYEAKEGMIIMTSDVTSFYPNLAIRNRISPGHIPKEDFCSLYEWFFEERKKYSKSHPLNYVYKIILNSTYGLSNDENSFLYDPLFTMSITINGQLLLTKLYEMLAEGIPGAVPIMQNTDGLEMMIPGCFKDKYLEICKQWEGLTKLQLEHDQYKKLIIADVNNYIAVYDNAEKKPKCKGRFEWEDQEKKKVSVLHKNKSFLIVPKAIHAYFTQNIQPEDFLRKHRNILDYCGGVKVKSDWTLCTITAGESGFTETPIQKITRFYISNSGVKLIKRHNTDGRKQEIVAGKIQQTVFNKFEEKEWHDYDVNEEYYLQQIRKEITNIDKTKKFGEFVQLEMF